jgi:hypothetical protein
MPWFKVDDTLHSHPKTRRAGLAAMGLWVIAGSYSCQYVTEGFIPDWFVSGQKSGHKHAALIVAAGLWFRAERDGEPGYQFHDWDHFQMSKDEVEAQKAHNRERQRKFREKRREAQSNAVTNGVTNAGSNGTPTLPVPTQPDPTLPTSKENQEEVGSESYVSNAHEPEHRVEDEPVSSPVLPSTAALAKRYTERVLCNRAKVCGIVQAALDVGYTHERIGPALDRLASAGQTISPDILRIEIDGKPNFPANGRASPPKQSTTDQRVASTLTLAQQYAEQERQDRMEIEA